MVSDGDSDDGDGDGGDGLVRSQLRSMGIGSIQARHCQSWWVMGSFALPVLGFLVMHTGLYWFVVLVRVQN